MSNNRNWFESEGSTLATKGCVKVKGRNCKGGQMKIVIVGLVKMRVIVGRMSYEMKIFGPLKGECWVILRVEC